MLYTVREGVDRSRLLQTYPRHKDYYEAFRAAGGGLVALGPFQTPDPAAGSMGIFTSREDAERFSPVTRSPPKDSPSPESSSGTRFISNRSRLRSASLRDPWASAAERWSESVRDPVDPGTRRFRA